MTARATDSSANVGTSTSSTFTYSTAAPKTTVTYPVNGTTYGPNWSGSISGTASASGGASVTGLTVAIENTTTGKWWNGSAFSATSQTFVAATGTTSWTYVLAATKLATGDAYSVTARATDSAANVNTSTPSTFTYSTAAPKVTAVGTTTTSGVYKAGQTIPVTVNFNEPVTVTGTPQLTLNTSPSETANYSGGTGTPTLTFTYAVAAGDMSSRLDYHSTTALTLNGGTIQDAATNAATLTLATVASGMIGCPARRSSSTPRRRSPSASRPTTRCSCWASQRWSRTAAPTPRPAFLVQRRDGHHDLVERGDVADEPGRFALHHGDGEVEGRRDDDPDLHVCGDLQHLQFRRAH